MTITSAVAGVDAGAGDLDDRVHERGRDGGPDDGDGDNMTAGCTANCGNANKLWVKAKITIAPDATNEIGQPHTFTATVFTDNGRRLRACGCGRGLQHHADRARTVRRRRRPAR